MRLPRLAPPAPAARPIGTQWQCIESFTEAGVGFEGVLGLQGGGARGGLRVGGAGRSAGAGQRSQGAETEVQRTGVWRAVGQSPLNGAQASSQACTRAPLVYISRFDRVFGCCSSTDCGILWEQEQLPYDASTLRLRLAANDVAELQDMYEALSQQAREITAEIIALHAPESEYPGAALDWLLDWQQRRERARVDVTMSDTASSHVSFWCNAMID